MSRMISIIVPVYNVKDYLLKCIDSLVKQTYQNFEILLIDDGSTDGSGVLCDQLMDQYPNVKAFHKENGGLSDARNYGIARSEGNYLTFVDGDDYLHLEACEKLLQSALERDAKLVVGGLMVVDEKGNIREEAPLCTEICVRSCEEALKLVFSGKGYSACGKLYKRELFSEIQFPFGKVDEDFATMYQLFFAAQEVVYCSDYVYYYYKRQGSITKSGFNRAKLDFVYNAADAAEYIREHTSNAELQARANAYLCSRIDIVIRMIITDPNVDCYEKELQALAEMMRAHKQEMLASEFIGTKDKIVMMIELINPKWLKIKYKIRKRFRR